MQIARFFKNYGLNFGNIPDTYIYNDSGQAKVIRKKVLRWLQITEIKNNENQVIGRVLKQRHNEGDLVKVYLDGSIFVNRDNLFCLQYRIKEDIIEAIEAVAVNIKRQEEFDVYRRKPCTEKEFIQASSFEDFLASKYEVVEV